MRTQIQFHGVKGVQAKLALRSTASWVDLIIDGKDEPEITFFFENEVAAIEFAAGVNARVPA